MKMNKEIGKFVKSSALFLVGSVLSKLIGIIFLPLYTKYIPTAEYGIYDVACTYSNIVIYFLFFEIWSTLLRFMYEAKTKEEQNKVSASAMTIFLISSLAFVMGAIALGLCSNIQYFLWIVVYTYMCALIQHMSFMARGMKRDADFAISGVIATLVTAASNTVMIVFGGLDYSSLFIAYILGGLCQCVYIEWRTHCIRDIRLKQADKKMMRQMLLFTLPLGVNAMSYWILNSSGKLVIQYILGNDANGLFAIGSKFSTLIVFVVTCFTYAWQSVSFEHENKVKHDTAFYTSASTMYMVIIGLATAALIPAIELTFPYLVYTSYSAARSIVPITLIVSAVHAYASFIGNIFYSIKKTKMLFASTLAGCIVCVGIALLCVKRFGIIGASYGMFAGYLVNVLIRIIALGKYIRFHIDYRYLLLVIILLAISTALFYLNNTFVAIGWLIISTGIVLIAVYRFLVKRKTVSRP